MIRTLRLQLRSPLQLHFQLQLQLQLQLQSQLQYDMIPYNTNFKPWTKRVSPAQVHFFAAEASSEHLGLLASITLETKRTK